MAFLDLAPLFQHLREPRRIDLHPFAAQQRQARLGLHDPLPFLLGEGLAVQRECRR